MKKVISIIIIASLSLFGIRAYAEETTVVSSETTIVSESVSEETTVPATEIMPESVTAETSESVVTEVLTESQETETDEISDSYTSESGAAEAETTVVEETSASEDASDTSETEETEKTEEILEEPEAVVSVELPVESTGESVFDFIIDPQKLITLTDAAAYNGARFEPDASLYFRNSDGWYDYSSKSDYLTFTNLGNTYVNVSLSAQVVCDSTVSVADTKYFGLGNSDMLYLALVDSNGNEVPVNEYGYAEINTEVPNGQYGMEYSFGLTGASNPYADWTNFSGNISILVVWEITPLGKWEALQLEEQITGEDTENKENILNEILETTPVEGQTEVTETSTEQEIVEETTEVSVNDGVTEESKSTSVTEANETSAETPETDTSDEKSDAATDTTV